MQFRDCLALVTLLTLPSSPWNLPPSFGSCVAKGKALHIGMAVMVNEILCVEFSFKWRGRTKQNKRKWWDFSPEKEKDKVRRD